MWYFEDITKQIHRKDINSVELQQVKLCPASSKELNAKWLVEMAEYIPEDNPQFIVNGCIYIHAGICRAHDGYRDAEEESEDKLENENLIMNLMRIIFSSNESDCMLIDYYTALA